MRTLALSLLLLLAVCGVAQAPALAQVAGLAAYTSEHYILHTDSPESVAKECSRVIEACWPELEKFFGTAPKLKKGEKLAVYFLETQQGWLDQMKTDNVAIPIGAGGYYNPGNRTVYLWKQPTRYTSRQLLIHEVMHQFHYIACCNNVGPKDTWYIEGIVEHMSRHYWDGEKLTLGVIPFCSLEDFPRLALELFERDDFKLSEMLNGKRASTRPEQWALCRYLLLKGDAKDWKALAKKLDGGQEGRNVFAKQYGDPDKLQPKILEWLKTQREPFVWVWNEWQGQGTDAVWGTAPTSYSLCRTFEPASHVEATVQIPAGDWTGGLIVQFKSTEDFTLFLLNQAGEWVVTRRTETWATLRQGKLETPKAGGSYTLSATRDGEAVKLSIDGMEVGSVDVPAGHMGVALRNSTLRFTGIKSRP